MKSAITFTVNSANGWYSGVSYSISIVYFQDELYDEQILDSWIIKLDDNWYIKRNYLGERSINLCVWRAPPARWKQ